MCPIYIKTHSVKYRTDYLVYKGYRKDYVIEEGNINRVKCKKGVIIIVVLISGGGTKESNIVVNEYFAQLIDYGSVLYIPNAGDEHIRSYLESYEYVREMFEELGVQKVHMITELNQINDHVLKSYSAIYFSGGSISKLLNDIRNAGIEKDIINFEKHKCIYGQSAGGIALGSDVTYFEEARNINPLSLINYAITCHYKDEQLLKIKQNTMIDTYCIRDNQAILFNGSKEVFINGTPIFIKK